MEPIDRATVWPYDEHGEPGEFSTSATRIPTGVAAERALGELEGGDALLYASGTAAATAVRARLLPRPGTTVALAEGAYFGTARDARQFEPWGLKFVEYDQTGPPPAEPTSSGSRRRRTRCSRCPTGTPCARIPALVVCDATVSTPVFLRALDEGADVVVHSATKFLTGHPQRAARRDGHPRPEEDEGALRRAARGLGLPAAPDAAAALLHGLESLERPHAPPDRDGARARAPARGASRACCASATRASRGLVSFDVADDAPAAVETRRR